MMKTDKSISMTVSLMLIVTLIMLVSGCQREEEGVKLFENIEVVSVHVFVFDGSYMLEEHEVARVQELLREWCFYGESNREVVYGEGTDLYITDTAGILYRISMIVECLNGTYQVHVNDIHYECDSFTALQLYHIAYRY
ncbi:MAG: hypothetical protein IJX39_06970 [Clostridia bacterium]|nr:hypothetical protein [Clostridia bacterium]